MKSSSSECVCVLRRYVFDVFVPLPSVHPQRLGSQERPCDGGQRYEDRRLRSRQRRAQYRLLQKDHERESYSGRSLCQKNNTGQRFNPELKEK